MIVVDMNDRFEEYYEAHMSFGMAFRFCIDFIEWTKLITYSLAPLTGLQERVVSNRKFK